jgi:histone H3/H4
MLDKMMKLKVFLFTYSIYSQDATHTDKHTNTECIQLRNLRTLTYTYNQIIHERTMRTVDKLTQTHVIIYIVQIADKTSEIATHGSA